MLRLLAGKMTAEIAILNRTAVTLAADSAITVGRARVWKNSNKLFAISSHNDIGIMIYGTGDYCGIPWEVAIKQFRRHIGKRVFETVEQCTKEFSQFLGEFGEDIGGDISSLNLYLLFLGAISECSSAVTEVAALAKRRQFIAKAVTLAAEIDDVPILVNGLTRDAFLREYGASIKEFAEAESGIHVTKDVYSKLVTLCYERTRRKFSSSYETGVVFAGYGSEEILPCLQEWIVDGRHGADARAWMVNSVNLGVKNSPPAYVIPFAQKDIAYLFMEGVQLDYLDFINTTLGKVLDEKSKRLIDQYVPHDERVVELARQRKDDQIITDQFGTELESMRQKSTVQPMLNVISSLPKEGNYIRV